MTLPPAGAKRADQLRALALRARDTVVTRRNRWLGLPPGLRALVWVVLSGMLFAVMGVLVKLAGPRLPVAQVTFFRAACGFLTLLPFAIAAGPGVLKTKRPLGHLMRGLIGATAMFCGFYALANLPLAAATAYGFTKPLFLVLLAAFMLGEKVRARRITATVAGFVGVLVMLRPHAGIEFAALVALFGAACVAGVVVSIKLLIRTEKPVTVLIYFGFISTAIMAAPAWAVWVPPNSTELMLLMAVGAMGASGQSAMIRAYTLAEATAIGPLDYLRLLYAAALGYLVFGEVPDLWMWAGAGIIIASTLYIARREARLGKAPAPPVLD
jgi:drug/metabolite transporter (DMT)-like permease